MKRRKAGSRQNTLCVSQMFRKICFKSRELGSDPIEVSDTRLLTIKTLSSSIICGLKIPSLCLTKTQRPGEQVFQEIHQTIIAKYKRPKAKTCCRHRTTHRTRNCVLLLALNSRAGSLCAHSLFHPSLNLPIPGHLYVQALPTSGVENRVFLVQHRCINMTSTKSVPHFNRNPRGPGLSSTIQHKAVFLYIQIQRQQKSRFL